MSRSPGLSSGGQTSHTHSASRAPSLSARIALVALLALAGAPVLPLLADSPPAAASLGEPDEPAPGPDVPAKDAGDLAARALVDSLADPSYRARQEASRQLLELGEAALPELRRGLESEDPELRRRARTLIDTIADRSAAEERREEQDRELLGRSALGRRLLGLPESTEITIDETMRRVEKMLDELERRPGHTMRLGPHVDRFDWRELDERLGEMHEQLLRGLPDFPAIFEGRMLGEWERDLLGRGGAAGGSSRVQIWRDGEKVFDSSRETTYAEVPSLGVVVESLHPSLRVHLPIPEGQGMLIGEVTPEGRAAGAGLEKHDILLTVGGTPVSDLISLRKALGVAEEGELELGIIRRGESRSVKVSAAPAKPDRY